VVTYLLARRSVTGGDWQIINSYFHLFFHEKNFALIERTKSDQLKASATIFTEAT